MGSCINLDECIAHPQQVNFNSTDFYNVLQWQEANHTSKSIVYMVQYKMYGEKQWNSVTLLKRQGTLWSHTLQEFKPLQQTATQTGYIVKGLFPSGKCAILKTPVKVVKKNVIGSTQKDSEAISPPKIKLTPQSRSIQVELFAPRTPFRRKNGSWITLDKIYIDFEYQVEITGNPVDHRPESCRATSTTISIHNLKPRTTYCMHARIQIPLFHKISKYGREKCATTFDGSKLPYAAPTKDHKTT
ncbi:interleukin-22 receptor subunit alpha-2-like [Rhincodon typus]|uniref:interleukin-22 receptor subunit alpha-2-like n=1 Tax=Rhincodon typus TaxID=259920 RepID=UPI002030A357|nr:interleukin-22 receptor subunit alpha-2-like [Rhincodon typus]